VTEDYYALLGVDVHADDDDIRRAWRKLALELHPDRAGSHATEQFQLLSVAYSVISDPAKRRAYDKRRGIPKKPAPPPPSPPAEDTPPPVRKAPGILLTRLSRNLDILRAMGRANIAADGVIDLFLEEEEWTEGGMVTVAMRADVHCPACRGSTNIPCTECKNTRVLEEQYSAWLAIRPGVEDGTILTPSAQLPGVVTPVRFRARRM
jgi:curved DNA-binding protein CbpA